MGRSIPEEALGRFRDKLAALKPGQRLGYKVTDGKGNPISVGIAAPDVRQNAVPRDANENRLRRAAAKSARETSN